MFGWKKKDKSKRTEPMITVENNLCSVTSKGLKAQGIKGAQWFADSKQLNECELCKVLDGKTISINHPDFDRFIPPLHKGCKCIRMYIGKDNIGEIYDWETPNENLINIYSK